MTSVWQLENQEQMAASEELNIIIEIALAGNRKHQNYLKKLWNEKWPFIKEKLFNNAGAVWYAWYMDGVNQHIANYTQSRRSENELRIRM